MNDRKNERMKEQTNKQLLVQNYLKESQDKSIVVKYPLKHSNMAYYEISYVEITIMFDLY